MVEQEHRVRKEEEAVACRAHRVIPDLEEDTLPTDAEGRSLSGKGQERSEEKVGMRGESDAWWRSGERRAQRKVYSYFNTVSLPLLLLAAGVGFPAACF